MPMTSTGASHAARSLSVVGGRQVGALPLGAEQREQLRGLAVGAPDRVRLAGVEFRGLPGTETEVLLARDQADLTVQDGELLVPLVGLKGRCGLRIRRRIDHLVGLDAPSTSGQRHEDQTEAPHRAQADAWVAGGRRLHEVVERHTVGTGQWQRLLQGRPESAVLEGAPEPEARTAGVPSGRPRR